MKRQSLCACACVCVLVRARVCVCVRKRVTVCDGDAGACCHDTGVDSLLQTTRNGGTHKQLLIASTTTRTAIYRRRAQP